MSMECAGTVACMAPLLSVRESMRGCEEARTLPPRDVLRDRDVSWSRACAFFALYRALRFARISSLCLRYDARLISFCRAFFAASLSSSSASDSGFSESGLSDLRCEPMSHDSQAKTVRVCNKPVCALPR